MRREPSVVKGVLQAREGQKITACPSLFYFVTQMSVLFLELHPAMHFCMVLKSLSILKPDLMLGYWLFFFSWSGLNIFFCGQVGGIPKMISRSMKRNVTNPQNLL